MPNARTTFCLLMLGMLIWTSARAQKDTLNNLVRRSFTDYDEEIRYFGKHNQFFTVRMFLKNGLVIRLDSYMLLPKTLPNGFPLDSLSRIRHHGPTRILYVNGRQHINCDYKEGILHGPFMVFYEDGTLKRKEYYRNGRLSKGQCFAPDGSLQPCQPFYQAAKFLGKSNDLETYLKQKLAPVIDGYRIRGVDAALTINEIGQVTRINVSINSEASASQQVSAVTSYVQQTIRNMPEWTPDSFNWKPAVNDGKPIQSICVLMIYRTYGTLQYRMSYRL